jgi:hypothetical protein
MISAGAVARRNVSLLLSDSIAGIAMDISGAILEHV